MEIIINNPFRILGIYAGAKTALVNKNFNRLKMFVGADQEIPDELSLAIFPCLGPLKRAKENIEYASSHLNLDQDKMLAALFWFYDGNAITDEPAFDELRESNIQGALNIWKKLVERGEVTERNFSAFQNISTLYLLRAFKGSFPDSALLTSAIKLKLQLLESDFALKYKAVVTDTTFKISIEGLQLLFLHEIESEIQKNKKYKESDIIDILGNIDFKAKPEFLKGFVEKPIEQIEKKIAEARVKRKANPANSVNIGNILYNETVENLNQLKSILGITNLKFSSISDKVSDEILQCGIDYFSHYKDTDTDPGKASMDLFRKAKTLAFGNIAKQRCQENTEGLQEWIEEKPERDKQAKILVDFEKLKNLIDEFEGRSGTVANGNQLLISAKPYLNNIKSVLGNSDELYLGISSRIASDAQGMCVVEINKLQEKIANTYDNGTKVSALLLLKQKVNEAWDVTTTIGAMDLSQDFRTRYSQNRTSLTNLKTQLTNIKKPESKRNNNGCLWIVLFIIAIFIVIKIYESSNNSNYRSPETIYTPPIENEGNTPDDISPEFSDQNSSGFSEAVNSDQSNDFGSDEGRPSQPIESEWKNNQLFNGDSPLNDCFGDGEFEGLASLTIENGSNSEAIVCLYDVDIDKTIRNSYIQKASNYKIKRIPQGNYLIRVFYGNDWNPNLSNPCNSNGYFESDTNFSEFDGNQFFQNNSEGYTTATITLYTVQGGNASTSNIDASTFFRK